MTQVDVLDLNDQLHQVWTGIDPSQPSAPAEFVAQWPTTPFLVKGVKIQVNTNHNLSTWEEIDAVALLGFLKTSGLGNTIAFNGAAGVLIASESVNNQVSRNSIHDNGGLGIDLQGDGPSERSKRRRQRCEPTAEPSRTVRNALRFHDSRGRVAQQFAQQLLHHRVLCVQSSSLCKSTAKPRRASPL